MNFGDLLNEYRGAGDPPPDGIYDAVVTKSEAVAASTGKPMIKVVFRVLTGPEANKTVPNNFVLTVDNPNAFMFFVRHMAVFGIDHNTLAQLPTTVEGLSAIAPHLVGKQARITVQAQPGRQLPNVSRVETIPGGMLSAAPQIQTNGGPADYPQPQVVPEVLTQQYPQVAPAPPQVPAPTPAPNPGYDQYGIVPPQNPAPAVLRQGEMVLPQQVQQQMMPPQGPPPQAPAPQPPGPQSPAAPQAQEEGVPAPPRVPF